MHAKREVEIMINKGLASFFTYPLPRGPLILGLKWLVFFTNNGQKNTETFLMPMNFIFS